MTLQYIGNCVDSFDENGNCVVDQLPWDDTTDFAYALENMHEGQITNQEWAVVAPKDFDYIEVNLTHFYKDELHGLYVAYDEWADVHYFFM